MTLDPICMSLLRLRNKIRPETIAVLFFFSVGSVSKGEGRVVGNQNFDDSNGELVLKAMYLKIKQVAKLSLRKGSPE